jgi:dinuclear metal center YbgI/SA1388 family protein
MKCGTIIEKLELSYPPMYAMEWDNIGLLVGDRDADITKVLVALDVTDQAVEDAVRNHADLIVTHHPLIFHPVSKITRQDPVGRRILALAENRISYYAMHTNFDVSEMADLNADELNLINPLILEETYRDETGTREGLGRVGNLENRTTLADFAGMVKKIYQLPSIRVYGDPGREVQKVAVCSGSGKSLVNAALLSGADVFVTGDLDYHTAIDAVASGLALIDAGHYGTEYGFISYMSDTLKRMFPELPVISEKIVQPYTVV